MAKIFLGGTCNGSTWRDELIPELDKMGIDYFNPVVEDWTPKCREMEQLEKDKCDIHLYVITKEIKGVYSIAEAVESAVCFDRDYEYDPAQVIFYVVSEGFDRQQLHSFEATAELIKRHTGKGNVAVKETLKELPMLIQGIV